jgi:mannose-1-phosphate guanylyltransferase
LTYERFEKICPENIIYTEQLAIFGFDTGTIGGDSVTNILLEPSRNNTAPCIAYFL